MPRDNATRGPFALDVPRPRQPSSARMVQRKLTALSFLAQTLRCAPLGMTGMGAVASSCVALEWASKPSRATKPAGSSARDRTDPGCGELACRRSARHKFSVTQVSGGSSTLLHLRKKRATHLAIRDTSRELDGSRGISRTPECAVFTSRKWKGWSKTRLVHCYQLSIAGGESCVTTS